MKRIITDAKTIACIVLGIVLLIIAMQFPAMAIPTGTFRGIVTVRMSSQVTIPDIGAEIYIFPGAIDVVADEHSINMLVSVRGKPLLKKYTYSQKDVGFNLANPTYYQYYSATMTDGAGRFEIGLPVGIYTVVINSSVAYDDRPNAPQLNGQEIIKIDEGETTTLVYKSIRPE